MNTLRSTMWMLAVLAACSMSAERHGDASARSNDGVAADPASVVQMAFFDDRSITSFIWEGREDQRVPLTIVDAPLLRFENVRAGEVLVEGVWTVYLDIPGDEMERVAAQVEEHGQVHLVWNHRVVRTFRPVDCAGPGKHSRQTATYFRWHDFSDDEAAAKRIARVIAQRHQAQR